MPDTTEPINRLFRHRRAHVRFAPKAGDPWMPGRGREAHMGPGTTDERTKVASWARWYKYPPRPPRTFKYTKPATQETAKAIVGLGQTDILRGAVQVIKQGGDNNLHSHTGMDGFWMVLKGRARYYGPGDEVLGELGIHEGIVIPRGAQYWFESRGDDDLELLRVVAFDRGVKNERVDGAPRKLEIGSAQRFDGQTG